MGFWSIIVPETTTNLILNPSIETDTTGWTAGGTNTVAQSGAQSRFGAYSLLCTYQDNDALASYNLTLTAVAHTFSVYLYIPANYDGTQLVLRANNWAAATGTLYVNADMTLTDQWQRLSHTFTPDAGDLAGQFQVREEGVNSTVGRYIYIDAAQAEALGHVTTYCDGDQLGCEWIGTAHASTSTRSVLSRAGGRVYDLADDFGFDVTRVIDSGVAPLTQHLDEYAIIPGGEVSSYKVHPRVLTLQGFMSSRVGFSTLHDQIQALIDILKPDAVPGNQPVILRYTEATLTKEISVRYESGLGGNWNARMCAEQRFAIRFLAADPFWYEIGESAALLDERDTATLRYLAGRLRSTGQWDDLGLTANPVAGGTIWTMLFGSDKNLYVGGGFTGMDNVPNRDYVAYYTPATDTWTTWGAGAAFDDWVFKILEGPDGTIYACGQFSTGGGGACDYIAYWDGAAWATLGAPLAAPAVITAVYDMAFDSDGNLIFVGNFTDLGGVVNADHVGMWTGAAYAAVGGVATGGANTVYAIALDELDNIYIGGTFANWNGDGNADCLAWYEVATSTWASVNATAINNTVFDLLYDRVTGLLYIGGAFTNAGGVADADYLATWNGQTFAAVGEGLTGAAASVNTIAQAPDGTIYISGLNLATAGGVTLIDHAARWTGSSWVHVDLDLPGAPTINAVVFGPVDPVISGNYDVYVGFSTTGAGYFAGATTVTNDGTAEAFPVIYISLTTGTSARLVQIRNETLGKEICFDYTLINGEWVVIDPFNGTFISSFYGSRPEAILSSSELATFWLQPGTNLITVFVNTPAANVTSYLIYRDKYWSND